MKALELRNTIHALMRKHRIQPVPCTLPLTKECTLPIAMEGIAATCDLDLDRVQLGPEAFGPLPQQVPLLHKHNATEPAGTIHHLSYASDGSLHVRCTVTHPMAARCGAFSYACHVDDYTMHNADSSFFYARVTKATLTEISLTSDPSNPKALITRRGPPPPHVHFYELMQRRVTVLQRLVPLLAMGVDDQPPQTSFRSLVEQINKGA